MILTAENPVADFSHDNLLIVIVKAVVIFALLVVMTLFCIWWERRVVGRMQSRPGPNRHGPFGLFQSLADGVKLALKEEVLPELADKAVFIIAPIISATAAFLAFAVIPLGPSFTIPFTDIVTPMQLSDLPVAVLFVLAIASVGVYGIVLAGWSSGSTYPLLGGLRSSAQVISYEIAMGLALISVFLVSGSMSTSSIVAAQASSHTLVLPFGIASVPVPGWNAVVLFPSFVIYVIAMIGETNRAPFDLPEAEGELVGGFHTEYSSLRFAMFFLAEYVNMVTVSAVATTLFLGGWHAPVPGQLVTAFAGAAPWFPVHAAIWGAFWFLAKLLLFIWFFIWLRGTLPRLRYDQFMSFGWKVLIPSALVWVLMVSVLRTLFSRQYAIFTPTWSVLYGTLVVLIAGAVFLWSGVSDQREARSRDRHLEVPEEVDPFAGGFPVPALPGQRLVRTNGRTPAPAATASVVAGALTESESEHADD